MKFLKMKLLLAALLTAFSFTASAAAPVQLVFFDFQAPDTDEVTGVRFPVIYGKGNVDMKGWDLPILAWSEMDSLKGVHWTPILFSGNRVRGEMTGVAASVLNWHEGQDTGLNLGLVNLTNNVKGLNWSFLNYATGYTVADVGAVNISEKSNFQLSFVNVTQELNGLQIGIVNCAKNGFLPCFIIFNFGSS